MENESLKGTQADGTALSNRTYLSQPISFSRGWNRGINIHMYFFFFSQTPHVFHDCLSAVPSRTDGNRLHSWYIQIMALVNMNNTCWFYVFFVSMMEYSGRERAPSKAIVSRPSLTVQTQQQRRKSCICPSARSTACQTRPLVCDLTCLSSGSGSLG